VTEKANAKPDSVDFNESMLLSNVHGLRISEPHHHMVENVLK